MPGASPGRKRFTHGIPPPTGSGATQRAHQRSGGQMDYAMKPLSCDPAKLKGLSEKLIISHYENNYGGAVKRLNSITEQLGKLDFASAPVFLINGLKREQLIAANSMILHELYFANLGEGDGPSGALAKALGGGSGWVVLVHSHRDGRLMNQWAADHTQSLAHGTPILALDMYEHSYHLDYGAKAGAYVDAFMRNIRWSDVATRHGACARNERN